LTQAPSIGIPEVYLCPSSGSRVNSVTPGGAMADYLGPSRHSLVPAGHPSALVNGIASEYPIACDKPGNHRGGGNVLRFDGSVSYREDPDYTADVKACSD
jgi:prepilin-type processing-associated H-X9-DG protein